MQETTVKHLTMAELEAALDHLRDAPKDNGELQLIVRRPRVDEREVLEEAELDPVSGLIGDSWCFRGSSKTADGGPHPEMQINIMNARVTALVAQEKNRWSLAGDQLYLDMDLSGARSQSVAAHRLPQVRLAFRSGCDEVCELNGGERIVLAWHKRESGPSRNRPARIHREKTLAAPYAAAWRE
jgi:hypothetical protein